MQYGAFIPMCRHLESWDYAPYLSGCLSSSLPKAGKVSRGIENPSKFFSSPTASIISDSDSMISLSVCMPVAHNSIVFGIHS